MGLLFLEADTIERAWTRGRAEPLLDALNEGGLELVVIAGWGNQTMSRDRRLAATEFLGRIRPTVLLTPGWVDLRRPGVLRHLIPQRFLRGDISRPEHAPTFESDHLAVLGFGGISTARLPSTYAALIRTFFPGQARGVLRVLVVPAGLIAKQVWNGRDTGRQPGEVLEVAASCGIELLMVYGARRKDSAQAPIVGLGSLHILTASGAGAAGGSGSAMVRVAPKGPTFDVEWRTWSDDFRMYVPVAASSVPRVPERSPFGGSTPGGHGGMDDPVAAAGQ